MTYMKNTHYKPEIDLPGHLKITARTHVLVSDTINDFAKQHSIRACSDSSRPSLCPERCSIMVTAQITQEYAFLIQKKK